MNHICINVVFSAFVNWQEAGYNDLDLYYDELETASKDDKYISISHSTIFQP
jgi:hypothetical protein